MLDDIDLQFFKDLHPDATVGTYIARARCDICGDSKTSKKKQRLYLYLKNGKTLLKCHNCGYSGNMWFYLKEYHPSDFNSYRSCKRSESLNSLRMSSFFPTKTPSYNTLVNDIFKDKIVSTNVSQQQPYKGLIPVYGETLKYILNRKCSPENFYTTVDSGFLETPTGDTLCLKDYIITPFDNNWRGFYSRSIKEKKFRTYVLDKNKDHKGINRIKDTTKDIYVFEGIFDALSTNIDNFFVMCGSSAVIDTLPSSNIIYVFDNDETGKEKAIEKLSQGFRVVYLGDLPTKDLNEALTSGFVSDKIELTNFINNNIVKGLSGIVKFRTKGV